MYKPTLALIALCSVLFVSASYAANPNICPGNLTLSTQAEVDAFKCREVSGSLTISGEDIVDLGPLSRLQTIGDYLSISDNTELTSVVDAFPGLTTVGGGIFVYDNPNLVVFSGFDALPETGDNIDFWYNEYLARVLGFSSLQTAGWSLEFGGNPNLVSIPEFESLQTISSSLFILDNRSLPSITGFNALQYVDWSFDIVWNSKSGLPLRIPRLLHALRGKLHRRRLIQHQVRTVPVCPTRHHAGHPRRRTLPGHGFAGRNPGALGRARRTVARLRPGRFRFRVCRPGLSRFFQG